MEEVVPFLTAIMAKDCMSKIAVIVRERLALLDPVFNKAADAMEEWLKLWEIVGSDGNVLDIDDVGEAIEGAVPEAVEGHHE
ncbi:putative UDP-arabinopyranose mutase 2 [Acorus calamus]|uniref:UDP-arabinopyranose mutase 2 n=1 Tax=Acorus calamus TaxID=4465 RepID=A0AAV9D2W3_ACOCL|nr:putative UDP-arabinopyranose mutase 2 [Acorus calamus]